MYFLWWGTEKVCGQNCFGSSLKWFGATFDMVRVSEYAWHGMEAWSKRRRLMIEWLKLQTATMGVPIVYLCLWSWSTLTCIIVNRISQSKKKKRNMVSLNKWLCLVMYLFFLILTSFVTDDSCYLHIFSWMLNGLIILSVVMTGRMHFWGDGVLKYLVHMITDNNCLGKRTRLTEQQHVALSCRLHWKKK